MSLYNRKIEKRMLAVCVGAITWESDPSTFLQDEDITNAQNLIGNVIDLFPDVDDAFTAVNQEAASGFTYNGGEPIADKSIEINQTVKTAETNLGTIKTQIGTDGKSHQEAEATRFYEEVRNHLIELYIELDRAILAYNTKQDQLKEDYMATSSGYEMVYTGSRKYRKAVYPSQEDADEKYGLHISLDPKDPYTSGLATTVKISGEINSAVSPENETVKSALDAYNECALGQGQKAEDLKAKTGITISSYGYASYASVPMSSTGLSDEYVQEYNSTHDKPIDPHYYGTMGLIDENGNPVLDENGNQVRVPVFYDANEHNPTYDGGLGTTTDASRLFTVVDGEICYLSNTNLTTSNDNTAGDGNGVAGSAYNYDISIPVDANGNPTEDTVYANHDNPTNVHIGSGGWSDTLYFKTPPAENGESTTYSVDYGSLQRTDTSNNPGDGVFIAPTAPAENEDRTSGGFTGGEGSTTHTSDAGVTHGGAGMTF